MTFISDPRDVTLYGPGLDMLWVAGDGNRPTIWNGAALAPADPDPLTLVGAPVAEVAPYQLESGADVALEGLDGATYRHSAVPRDPAADAVVIVFFRMPRAGIAGEMIFSSRTTGPGLTLSLASSSQLTFYVETAGGAGGGNSPANSVSPGAISIAILGYDSVAHTVFGWTPGGVLAPVAVPAGAIVGDGIGICVRPSGAGALGAGSGLLAVAYLLGAGIAPLWAADTYYRCRELRHRLCGTWPRQGGMPTTTRATAATRIDRNGRLWIYSSGIHAAGDSVGFKNWSARTNLCYNNINCAAITGLTASGGTLTAAVADTSALATAGLQSLGPAVFTFAPGAGDQSVRCGAATGATGKHAISLYARGAAGGESVHVGLWDTSAGAFTGAGDITLTTAWQRFIVQNVTPGDSDCLWCIECHAGDTVYFIGQQLEAGVRAGPFIPNWATAATAVRNAETLDTTITPSNAQGSIQVTITPDGWSGVENAADVGVLTRSTGSDDLLHAESSSAGWATGDGTTQVTDGTSPADGTADVVRVRWGATQSIDVDGARTTSAYDGARAGTGVVRIGATVAGVRIKDFKIYRGGGG